MEDTVVANFGKQTVTGMTFVTVLTANWLSVTCL